MIIYNNKEVKFGQFPNGEVNLKKIKLDPLDVTHVVTLKYESDADLFHLLLVRKALDVPATLRITYTPYSRMDRDSNTYTFSLKTFTDFINSMGWEKVVIYEPHSDVLPALLDRVQVVDVITDWKMLLKINNMVDAPYQVCFPDVGAYKRYTEKLKTPDPIVGFKLRDFDTGHIIALELQGEKHVKDVVIFDDLCSKGGTFVLAAKELKKMGFERVFLAVAHCENTIFEGEVLNSGLIERVITTDSIVRSRYFGNLYSVPLAEFGWT